MSEVREIIFNEEALAAFAAKETYYSEKEYERIMLERDDRIKELDEHSKELDELDKERDERDKEIIRELASMIPLEKLASIFDLSVTEVKQIALTSK
jgi:hypothetical protein